MSSFTLTAVISLADLLQPFPWLFVLMAVALFWLWRRSGSRRQLLLVIIPFALLWIFCMPLSSHFALGSLEWNYPPRQKVPAAAPVIVVLSGGIYYPDSLVSEAQLSSDTVDRCFEGAALYHGKVGGRLLLSGGKVDESRAGPQLAEAMKTLMMQLGVPAKDILLEPNSRSTYENAVESARILKEQNVQRIVLVTDAAHLPRAIRCFRRQGIEVVPWGCRYRARPLEFSPMLVIPHPSAAEGTQAALHEWLGLAWYWLRGWI
jgi:uncharacterized SAM-binding protein YcdF (DUF218 family)